MRFGLLLVLVSLLVSGCTVLGDDKPLLVTAHEAHDAAEQAAQRWAADAVLESVSAVEMDAKARLEARDDLADSREELEEAKTDGDIDEAEYRNVTRILAVYDLIVGAEQDVPGDGRAAVWFFQYYSGQTQSQFGIAVSRGVVVFSQPTTEDVDPADQVRMDQRIRDWNVDSDDATQAATLGDQDFARLRKDENVVSSTYLWQGEKGSTWSVGIESQDDTGEERDEAWVAVSAVNGSLLRDEVLDPFVGLLWQESGGATGDFTASAPGAAGVTFDVQMEGHQQLAVEVLISPAPITPVTVTVTDPQGTQTAFQVTMQPGALDAQGSIVLWTVPAGTFTVELGAQIAVRNQWTMSWCTDGIQVAQGEFQATACSYIVEQAAVAGARAETLSFLPAWSAPW